MRAQKEREELTRQLAGAAVLLPLRHERMAREVAQEERAARAHVQAGAAARRQARRRRFPRARSPA